MEYYALTERTNILNKMDEFHKQNVKPKKARHKGIYIYYVVCVCLSSHKINLWSKKSEQ